MGEFEIADYSVALKWRDGSFILEENDEERRISVKSAERWFKKHFPRYSWRKTLREIETFKKKAA